MQVPGATAYFGSVGKDEYADKLREAATAGGVHVSISARHCALLLHAIRQNPNHGFLRCGSLVAAIASRC